MTGPRLYIPTGLDMVERMLIRVNQGGGKNISYSRPYIIMVHGRPPPRAHSTIMMTFFRERIEEESE